MAIHRITQCAPDLDENNLKPNQARSATNLNFSQGTAESNYSGGSLVNDLELVPYTPPSGDNRTIGKLENNERKIVIRADWNSNGFHRFIRFDRNGATVITEGAWLGFVLGKDVSITTIGGLLYWTNVPGKQPSMLNIEKAIATYQGRTDVPVYPPFVQDWMYTQIKRPSGLFLEMIVADQNLLFDLKSLSVDYLNTGSNPFGLQLVNSQVPDQFATYYIYDNFEDTRISPITPAQWVDVGLTLRVPLLESETYLRNLSLVSFVVFIWRRGNSGPWYVAKRVPNIPSSYTNIGGSFYLQYTIPNTKLLPQVPVPSNITNADFDSTPTRSGANTIADSRLFHANYTRDYPNWTGLTLSLTKRKAVSNINNYRTFKEDGRYNVGIGVYDEDKRKIGVVNSRQIQFDPATYPVRQFTSIGGQPPTSNYPTPYNGDLNNTWWLDFVVGGIFPSWCKYWSLEYSKALNYTYFNKTTSKLYYWYTKNGVDFFAAYGAAFNNNFGAATSLKGYTFRGYAFELTSGEPFLFNEAEQQYLRVFPQYWAPIGLTPATNFDRMAEYKIAKMAANLVFIETPNMSIYIPSFFKGGFDLNDPANWIPIYYQIELLSRPKSDSEFIWQSTSLNPVGIGLTGTVYGDCYINEFKKLNSGSQAEVLNIKGTGPGVAIVETPETIRWETVDQYLTGFSISMNPTNIYAQNWDSDIGQPNAVNEDQMQTTLENWITWTDTIILGSQVNGLSKFNSIDSAPMPATNGAIVDLKLTNASLVDPGVMIAFAKLSHESIYLGATQFTQSDGNTTISGTTGVVGTHRPLQGQFGVDRIKNIQSTPFGTIYYYSNVINDLIRYSGNEQKRIGFEFGFSNTLREEVGFETDVFINFNQITEEVILVPFQKRAYIFSDPREKEKSFQGFREYIANDDTTPEWGASLSVDVFYFLNGQIWRTNSNLGNTFFGEVKNPRITVLENELQAQSKAWAGVEVFGPVPLKTRGYNSDGQECELISGNYIPRLASFDAAFQMDKNSNGGQMAGNPLQSRLLLVDFEWDAATFTKLDYIKINSNLSNL